MRRCARSVLAAALVAATASCGGAGDPPSRRAGEAIVGGAIVDAPGAPVLFLESPEGACSAVLLAPSLVATTRHCVARTTPGPFSCTPSGDLVLTGSGAGEIGTDDPPASVSFFIGAGSPNGGPPDALGAQILSTGTPTACRDDLAFVVLDRPIAGPMPAPVRLTAPTEVGEPVSVWGFGLTDQPAPPALRVRSGVPVEGVGPDQATTTTQPAPVRSVRVGPVTCQGDSGGPIISDETGAVVALVSLGSQAGTTGPFCSDMQLTDTIGPRLGAYPGLVAAAFQAAGATPINETAPPKDASSPDAVASEDAGAVDAEAVEPDTGVDLAPEAGPLPAEAGVEATPPTRSLAYRLTGGGACEASRASPGAARNTLAWGLAWAMAAIWRRRR